MSLQDRRRGAMEDLLAEDVASVRAADAAAARGQSSAGGTKSQFDKLDLMILEAIQRDVTLPVCDLAERVCSSKSVVWRRIQRMLETGIIRERVAVVNPASVGLNVLVFVRVRMTGHARDTLAQFAKAMRECPEVLECHSLLGDVDFLLKVVARSLDDYQEFIFKKLSRLEGVREVKSSVSVGQVVSTTQLPLRWLASANAGQFAAG